MEEIQQVFQRYLQNYQEAEAIKKEIRESQRKNKMRLELLKKENQQFEKKLVEYMLEHNLPGLRKNGFVLLCHEKRKHASKQKKEEHMEDIFRRNQVDASNPLYRELKTLIIDSQFGIEGVEHRLRCQKINDT